MNKYILVAFFLISLSFASNTYIENHLLIKINNGYYPLHIYQDRGVMRTGIEPLDELNVEHQCILIKKIYAGENDIIKDIYLFEFEDIDDMGSLRDDYLSINEIQAVSYDYICSIAQTYPNDWSNGPENGLIQIDAPRAWDITTGNSNIIFSNIDTGLDYHHPDLGQNIWQNMGEDIDGDGVVLIQTTTGEWEFDPDDINGIDDDNNGYIDDLVGWDFWENDNDPMHHLPTYHPHGTQTGGTMAQVGNNDYGGVGVCWDASLMAIQVTDHSYLSSSYYLPAIAYSIDNGAHILNMSWGGRGSSTSSSLYNLLHDAYFNHNVTLTAAAMNRNTSSMYFPACYDFVIGVAAVNLDDQKSSVSNFGSWVDVSAPRFDYGTAWEDWHQFPHIVLYYAGQTSTAAPYTAGLAGLILSEIPDIPNTTIRSIINISADNIDVVNQGQPWEGLLGSGRVNAYKAVLLARYAPDADGMMTGTLSQDITDKQVLYGNVSLNCDIEVRNGGTVIIVPGTDISLNGHKITVNGQLLAEGTSQNDVSFNPNGGFGELQIFGDALPSSFENVHFKNTIIIYESTANSAGFFNNSTLSHSVIIMYNNDINISNSSFIECQFGVAGFASSPDIINCNFNSCGQAIIAYDNSDPIIKGCQINGGGNGIGLDTNTGSMPKLGKQEPGEWDCDRDNNSLSNCYQAVIADNGSYPDLGYYAGIIGGNINYASCGWNRFYDNDYDIVNKNKNRITAIGNNWYAPAPPGSQPSCSNSTPGNVIGEIDWEPTAYDYVGNNIGPSPKSKESLGDYEGAIADYKAIIETVPDSAVAVKAVYDLSRVHRKANLTNELITLLENYGNMLHGTESGKHALSQATSHRLFYSDSPDILTAQSNIENIRQYYQYSDLDLKLLFEEAHIQTLTANGNMKINISSGDISKSELAIKNYKNILDSYPESPVALLARVRLGKNNYDDNSTITHPLKHSLSPNYPNPFNPATSFTVNLTEPTVVELVLLDIRGAEIRKLHSGQLSAGISHFTIDGSGLPSGVYFYRLTTPKQTITRKCLLLK